MTAAARGTIVLLSAAALLTGCASATPGVDSASVATSAGGPAAVLTTTPVPASTRLAAGSATALLEQLPVKGRAPKTGYDRDQFGQAWADTDRNGCDTRNDVLRRDLTDVALKPDTHGCVVLTGTLRDPYSGTRIAFRRGPETSITVQIDHVVALSDAWQKGAQQWPSRKRLAFANDPLDLLAVDGDLNQQKRDSDAASWLPPSARYRCDYVARQIAVKVKYGLWVTAAERAAMARVLHRCPGQEAPSGGTPTVAPFDAPVHRGQRAGSPTPLDGVAFYR